MEPVSRRVLATLIRLLGDFDPAEEAMHDAFVAAVERWPRNGRAGTAPRSGDLDTVLQVVYLVFTEGYAASSCESLMRADLSSEAIRLGRLLVELLLLPEVQGLLALVDYGEVPARCRPSMPTSLTLARFHITPLSNGVRFSRTQLTGDLRDVACDGYRTVALQECGRRKATLDRLGRNVAFISEPMESGADFVCCDNPHANRLRLHMLAAFAEHERVQISRRTREALAASEGSRRKARQYATESLEELPVVPASSCMQQAGRRKIGR